jgi:flagellar protein FlaG
MRGKGMPSKNSHMEVCIMKVAQVRAPEMVAKYEKIEVAKKPNVNTTSEEPKKVETNDKNIEEAVKKVNKHLDASNTKIKFKIHDSENSLNNKVSIKVVDEENDKVIAEIPSEEAIELSEKLDQIIGFLFDAAK